MCGIVGLFLKDASLESDLGNLLSEMLITMTDRGPDVQGLQFMATKTQLFQSLLYNPTTPIRRLKVYPFT